MTEKDEGTSLTARPDETSGVDIPKRKGRPPTIEDRREVQAILNDSAPCAALILAKHIDRRRGFKHLATDLQRACEYVIDHAIGKSRQKIEHSGGILTYADLAKGADTLDKKPREVLAEVEELANKYQEKTTDNPSQGKD